MEFFPNTTSLLWFLQGISVFCSLFFSLKSLRYWIDTLSSSPLLHNRGFCPLESSEADGFHGGTKSELNTLHLEKDVVMVHLHHFCIILLDQNLGTYTF